MKNNILPRIYLTKIRLNFVVKFKFNLIDAHKM